VPQACAIIRLDFFSGEKADTFSVLSKGLCTNPRVVRWKAVVPTIDHIVARSLHFAKTSVHSVYEYQAKPS
jgi:hypothetical protein